MLAEFAGKVPERERFDTFWRVRGAYQRAGRIEEWLRESERIGLPIRDELWMHPWTAYTCDRCSVYAWELDQNVGSSPMTRQSPSFPTVGWGDD